MSRQSELNSYISQVKSRLQLHAWLSGSAILTVAAVATTTALVLVLNHFAFPAGGVKGARVILITVLTIVVVFGTVVPILRLTSARAVRKAEALHPFLEQRLTTFHERQQLGDDPFLELLAADTLSHTQDATPSSIVPGIRLFALSGVGLG